MGLLQQLEQGLIFLIFLWYFSKDNNFFFFSGTEPKIKYYIEHHGKFENKEQVDKELEKISTAITTHLIQPEKFKLQSRTTK